MIYLQVFGDSYFLVNFQLRQAVLIVRCRRKTSIFVRKALHIRPRDRNMRSVLLARREGCALFDEDDVYDGLWNFAAACLNGHLMYKEPSLVPFHAAHAAHLRASLAGHIAGIKFPVDLPQLLLTIDVIIVHLEQPRAAPVTEALNVSDGLVDNVRSLLTGRVFD